MPQRPYTQFQTAINYTAATRARRISKNCAFFYCIPGYWILAAHSGPAKRFMPLIKPVIASRDSAETIYGVSDCYQLRSGHTVTSNFKKKSPFSNESPVTGIWPPTADPKPFQAPYNTRNCL